MRNAVGKVQDRTYTSIMEDYLRALPPGTQVTKKMLMMHGVPERIAQTYMHFFVKWGAAKRVEYADNVPKADRTPAIIYTPHSDRRGLNRPEWRVPEEGRLRPRASSSKPDKEPEVPYLTANGNELKVVEPPPPAPEPEKVRLDELSLNEVREGFKLLLKEFGLNMYRKGSVFSLEP